MFMTSNKLAIFVKQHRKAAHLDQKQFAIQAGVGLAFLRALEQGKGNPKISNVNKVLNMFGYELEPGSIIEDR